jgi:hypothetical protein
VDAKKVAVLGVAALALFYVIVNPTDAACLVEDLFAALEEGANRLFTFAEGLLADA